MSECYVMHLSKGDRCRQTDVDNIYRVFSTNPWKLMQTHKWGVPIPREQRTKFTADKYANVIKL